MSSLNIFNHFQTICLANALYPVGFAIGISCLTWSVPTGLCPHVLGTWFPRTGATVERLRCGACECESLGLGF